MKKQWETLKRKNLLWILECAALFTMALVIWGFARNELGILLLICFGAMCLIRAAVYAHEKKEAEENPEYVRKQRVEEQDERNIMVRDRSAHQTLCVLKWTVHAAFMISLVLYDWIFSWIFLGISIAQDLIFYILKRYNNKKL